MDGRCGGNRAITRRHDRRGVQAQFADPSFITYVRTTESVTLDAEGARAAETGTWVATWKDATSSGPYLAVWKKSVGQWVIESETFVTVG